MIRKQLDVFLIVQQVGKFIVFFLFSNLYETNSSIHAVRNFSALVFTD